VREQIPLEGFDKEQERRLKSKKRSQVYQSEEHKWKGVYRILFPDDNEDGMPAPCRFFEALMQNEVAHEAQISNISLAPEMQPSNPTSPASKSSHA
jgi:hypothetical protein